MNLTDEMERLQTLFVSGALTADEFQKAKTRLLEGEGFPEGTRDTPVPVDWEHVAEQPPASGVPIRTGEVTGKDALQALEAGAVSGAIIGIPLSFASGIPIWWAVIGVALTGAIIWTAVSLGVKATVRSRGFGALLLRLLYGTLAVVYGLALLYVVAWAIYIKSHQGDPRPEPYIPPAKIR